MNWGGLLGLKALARSKLQEVVGLNHLLWARRHLPKRKRAPALGEAAARTFSPTPGGICRRAAR